MSRPIGFKHTEATKAKMSQKKKEWDKVHPNPMEGKHHSAEAILRFRLKNAGANNPNWKGGRTELAQHIRESPKNKRLRTIIFKRDNYTCQSCGQISGRLEVDHIIPFAKILSEFLKKYATLDIKAFSFELYLIALKYKPFWDKKNLRALCENCNRTRKHSGTD